VGLDAAIEQLIPPLSIPLVLGLVCLGGSLALGAVLPAALAALGLAGLVSHLLAGLRLSGAPPRAYLVLGCAPLYVAWKVGLYARALLTAGSTHWIRTARVAAASEPR
jgi:hypothetical protein